MNDADYMRLAIQMAQQGVKKGEMPFGACIVRNGRLISTVHNSARANLDTTAHAEMQAIREASGRLKTLDLSGCEIYSTCEPCPMCFAACVWARVSRIVYACRIEDAEKAGIRQIPISSAQMNQWGRSGIDLSGDVLRNEAQQLFNAWAKTNTGPG